jgi:urease accessory protein
MLLDRVIGKKGADATVTPARRSLDVLDLTWRQCGRRAVRGRTRGGRDVGILLPPGVTLRHDDVLAAGEGHADEVLLVSVQPCDVWVAEFTDGAAMAAAALELGNLHVPVEVCQPPCLVTLPDGPVRAVLDRYATTWRPEVRRFQPLRATVGGAALRMADDFGTTRVPATGVAATGVPARAAAPRRGE